jgi:hypothetical protein
LCRFNISKDLKNVVKRKIKPRFAVMVCYSKALDFIPENKRGSMRENNYFAREIQGSAIASLFGI